MKNNLKEEIKSLGSWYQSFSFDEIKTVESKTGGCEAVWGKNQENY